MSWTLYQNYYKDEQLKEVYSFARLHYNSGLTIFFESEVVSRLVPDTETEKVAVCSWKLREKTSHIGRIVPEMFDREFQVLSLTRNGREHKMLAMFNTWHPKGIEAMTLLFQKMGLGLPKETKQPIYQFHFMAKTEIYKRFVSEFLKPAMNLIETDEELRSYMLLDSKYHERAKKADLKSVKAKLGLDFYPLCPFVLERCPSLWFDMHRIPVSYL